MCREKGPQWRRCSCGSKPERKLGRRAKLLFGSAIGANRARVDRLPDELREGDVATRTTYMGSVTDPEILAVGLQDSLHVVRAVAGAPGLTPAQQETVASSADRGTRVSYAGNVAGDPGILERLATDPSPSVRRALAGNSSVGDASLFALAKEQSPVGRAAQANLNTPTAPVPRPVRQPATNRFGGACPACGTQVPKLGGQVTQGPRGWIIAHRSGECPSAPVTPPGMPAVEEVPVPAPRAGGPEGWQPGQTFLSPKNGWVTCIAARTVNPDGTVTPARSVRATRAEIAPHQAIIDQQALVVTHRAAIERLRNAHPSQDSCRSGGTSYVISPVGAEFQERISIDPVGALGGRLAYYSIADPSTKRGVRVTASRFLPSIEAAAAWQHDHRG